MANLLYKRVSTDQQSKAACDSFKAHADETTEA